MGFQTSYALTPAVAVPGLLADSGHGRDLGTGFVANATIASGLFCCFHTGDKDLQIRATAATGEVTDNRARGVTVFMPFAPNAPNAVGDCITYMKKGRIWVNVEEAVTPASPVFVRFAAGAFPTLGAFRASDDTASAVALPNGSAKYITAQATIGGLALLELNLP